MIQYFQDCFLKDLGSYENLRKSFIHNDVNDNNIIISEKLISADVKGIIDFGDTVKSQIINDLAVTCTYAIMNCHNPLSLSLIHI